MIIRVKLFFAFVFILTVGISNAQQNTVVISDSLFDNPTHQLILSKVDGWYFRQGNDPSWTAKEISPNGWKKMQPAQFDESYADANGKAEGWFLITVSVDSSIKNLPSGVRSPTWAASEIYVNGTLVTSFGQTGGNGKPFRENRTYKKEP